MFLNGIFTDIKLVNDIINSVSYTKEINNQWKWLQFPYNIVLDIVSDADRIDAIG